MTPSERRNKAEELFSEGYNCAQAVFLSFCDELDIDNTTALRISSSFGGGMGRLREVCGAVSAMFMVAGLLYDKGNIPTQEEKMAHYARIQELAARFRKENGTIICRELLDGVETTPGSVPEQRTEQYYQKRPCGELCEIAANILSQYIEENPL